VYSFLFLLYKKCKNWPRNAGIIIKNKVARFFDSRCSFVNWLICARCHLPSGKIVWLCSEHQKQDGITVLSDEVADINAAVAQDVGVDMNAAFQDFASTTNERQKGSNAARRMSVANTGTSKRDCHLPGGPRTWVYLASIGCMLCIFFLLLFLFLSVFVVAVLLRNKD